MPSLKNYLNPSRTGYRFRHQLWHIVAELRRTGEGRYSRCGTLEHEGYMLRTIHSCLLRLRAMDSRQKQRWASFYGLSIPDLEELERIALLRTRQAMRKCARPGLFQRYEGQRSREIEQEIRRKDRLIEKGYHPFP